MSSPRRRPAAITPQGVRHGDPAVLAALAVRRGPAVLAFAAEVCDPQYVVRAAADAFARFRALVASPAADANVHPDALLLRCSRRAALLLAPPGPDLGCGPAVDLLLARAERTISPRDAGLLSRHLESCAHCAALGERLDAAERAYRDAGETELEPDVLAPMVAAMAAAAPVVPPDPAAAPVVLPDPAAAPPVPPDPAAAPPVPPDPAAADPDSSRQASTIGISAANGAATTTDEREAPAPPAPAEEEPPPAEEHPPPPPAGDEPPPPAEERTPDAPREIPIGTRRVTGTPASHYELPAPLPPVRRRRARRAAKGAAAASTAAASITRRARRAVRDRLERPGASPPAPAGEAPSEETGIWTPVEPFEFAAIGTEPAQRVDGPAEALTPVLQAPPDEPTPLPVDDELQETAARAAARHYRRLRHRRQAATGRPAPGNPPRLERPRRDRGPHLPLRAHGPQHLALPAGLLAVAVLVIMAVSGVFGGGGAAPTRSTVVSAAPQLSLVTGSATSLSLTEAERIATRPAGTSTP